MSIYDGISGATLATWLAEAQTALHALATGQQTVSVGMGDKKVTYTPADVDKLKRHIRELQTAIAVLAGTSTPTPYAVATWTR